jgi:hypothetical protein
MLVVTTPVDQDQPAKGTAESCPEMAFPLRNVTSPMMESARLADLYAKGCSARG